MMERLIIDDMLHWIDDYHIDGLRYMMPRDIYGGKLCGFYMCISLSVLHSFADWILWAIL